MQSDLEVATTTDHGGTGFRRQCKAFALQNIQTKKHVDTDDAKTCDDVHWSGEGSQCRFSRRTLLPFEVKGQVDILGAITSNPANIKKKKAARGADV